MASHLHQPAAGRTRGDGQPTFVCRVAASDVELRVTSLDIVSTGHAPGGYNPSIPPRASIYDLKYREAQSGGGESPGSPEGLYREYSSSLPWDASDCVLPDICRDQTEEVIREILGRFPDTRTFADRPSKPSALISLGLNKPADQ